VLSGVIVTGFVLGFVGRGGGLVFCLSSFIFFLISFIFSLTLAKAAISAFLISFLSSANFFTAFFFSFSSFFLALNFSLIFVGHSITTAVLISTPFANQAARASLSISARFAACDCQADTSSLN